jgi:four helix bundle protein|tara:strand:+ start:121 stop:477 length:357 start_codon:yes stop_codon:yes gene_type:complete
MARHNFRDLVVWQKARIMVKEIYLTTAEFPSEEKFGLTSQLRRAVVSIAANISEGAGRGTDKDFAHFLNMSEGSCNECMTLIILAEDLKLLEKAKSMELIEKLEEVNRMINGFRKRLV